MALVGTYCVELHQQEERGRQVRAAIRHCPRVAAESGGGNASFRGKGGVKL